MCKVLHFFHQYMMSCNYFWMLCEGLYLHTLIVVSVFAEGQRMWWYYLLGWGRYLLLLSFDLLLPLSDGSLLLVLIRRESKAQVL